MSGLRKGPGDGEQTTSRPEESQSQDVKRVKASGQTQGIGGGWRELTVKECQPKHIMWAVPLPGK